MNNDKRTVTNLGEHKLAAKATHQLVNNPCFTVASILISERGPTCTLILQSEVTTADWMLAERGRSGKTCHSFKKTGKFASERRRRLHSCVITCLLLKSCDVARLSLVSGFVQQQRKPFSENAESEFVWAMADSLIP
jgi:hypothetical protein